MLTGSPPSTRDRTTSQSPKVRSLLDASTLGPDNGKVKLSTQYRVPRDIANLLNARIYRGDYNTADTCNVPLKGFTMVHVRDNDGYRGEGKRYINEAEIDQCLEIVRELIAQERTKSIMILTPVSLDHLESFLIERHF